MVHFSCMYFITEYINTLVLKINFFTLLPRADKPEEFIPYSPAKNTFHWPK